MDESNVSYSIYIEKRPPKILYVFDKSKVDFQDIDKIIEYNKRKWGGRYNFILTTTNSKIDGNQWKFLKQYDPDFVKLAIPATEELAIDLDTKITPLQVTNELGGRGFSSRIDSEGISILPTLKNIHSVSNSFLSDVYYVTFDVENCEDPVLKEFIERNFGSTDLRDVHNLSLRKYPFKKEFKITNKTSFINAISSFNDFKPYVFPIQLSTIGDFINDDRTKDNEVNFYVFVGDSPHELIDFWNNPFYLQSWTRNRIRQLWIPTQIAEDPELTEALRRLIQGRADPYGSGQKIAIFSTRTLSDTKIDVIANNLTDKTWLRKTSVIKKTEEYPDYENYFAFDRNKSGMEHYRGTSEQEKIIVPPPDIKEGTMGGEHWMNDLYIQLPEKKVVPVNFDTWLQLPKNNSVAYTVVQKSPARITSNGLPSVLTSRSNEFSHSSQDIVITIPKTHSIFASMILNTSKPYFTNDIRSTYTKPYEYTIEISGAGRHMHGFLEVFGSLEGAYQIFEERHWRLFFESITNVSPEKEVKRYSDIKKRLAKKITTMTSVPANLTSDRFIDWLSGEIQKTAKTYADANPKASSFFDLESIAKNELAEYNLKNPGNKFRYTKKRLMEALRRLTDGGIVLLGYELKCPNCLNREWRALNEVSQNNVCRGCGYENPFPPDTEIKYRLNSLVENGVRNKGVVPVILGLGKIFRDANNYFDFLPPVNIYKKGKLVTDLDICCVIDGEFVIGEVKARHYLFHPGDFTKITTLAKAIHPNKVVFTSLDKSIPTKLKDDVQKVKDELNPLGISVEWIALDSNIFEAAPIF